MYPLSNQIPSPPITHHLIVEELNLRHLHSYDSQGGSHWGCCVSRFFHDEPCTVSTAPTRGRCRQPTQRAHQMASHEPFDERSARMSRRPSHLFFSRRKVRKNS